MAAMKVTCGACWGSLKVESRLADSVARCPKCHELIRIPPRNSPAGANAVVVTDEDDAELPKQQEGGPAVTSMATPTESGRRLGPKTEPLPTTLTRTTSAPGSNPTSVHQEPARHKTRPLPKPVGRPSYLPGLSPWPGSVGRRGQGVATGKTPEDRRDGGHTEAGEPRKTTLFSPLVPAAFVSGLLIGAVLGWFIGRPSGPVADNRTVVARPQQTPVAAKDIVPPERPAPDRVNPPEKQVPSRWRGQWLATQPDDTAVEIAEATASSIRVAGVMDQTPAASRLYCPAPPGQVYVELKATLTWTGRKAGPVTINLGGRNADCWLVTRDGRVFGCLGRVRQGGPTSAPDSPADSTATVKLDANHPQAEVSLLFLVPARLPKTRLQITGLAFADLVGDIREPDPVVSGRSLAGRWEPIPEQEPLAQFRDQPVLAAFAATEKSRRLLIERDGDHFRIQIEGTAVEGELSQRGDDSALFEATLQSTGQGQVGATLRVFDGSRKLLLYFGWGRSPLAYRRVR
ncbi:MAG: hypothetical protein PHU85_11740 [Phycisphaerae bacterium]|nr:hypothetical protein [Phycisphaerae bacterium]